MSARHVRRLLLAGVLGAAAARAAGDEVRFFEDESFSFERERARAPEGATPGPTAPAASPAQTPSAAEPPAPQPPRAGTASSPVRGAQPPVARKATGGLVTAGPASPQVIGGAFDVDVVRVRALTEDERSGLAGKLRCTDPLAADIRPGARTRPVIARVLKMPEEDLPETVAWVFGREQRCFDRSGLANAQQYEALDAAARQLAPPLRGGR